jgi:hypothetical protein
MAIPPSSPRDTAALMNNSANSASLKSAGALAEGRATSASRLERMILSRRNGSIVSLTCVRKT